MPGTLRLSRLHLKKIRQHLEACLPEEGCGLIAGLLDTAEFVLPVRNELHDPVRFRMDPVEQLEKMIWIEDQGLEILAIFHSHPAGPGYPSETDIAEFAYPGTITIIGSKEYGVWQFSAFEIEDRSYKEIELDWK
jgi:proteasome lid subunit RPN8/RPN11